MSYHPDPRSTAAVLVSLFIASGCVTVRRSGVTIIEPEEQLVISEPGRGPDDLKTKHTLKVERGGILTVEDVTPRIRGWIGVRLEDLDEREASRRKLTPFEGVLVYSVESGSPAAVAGLVSGDVIQRVGSEKASSAGWLRFRIERSPPETPLPLHVMRRGKETGATVELDLSVTVAGRPDQVRNIRSYSLRYLSDTRHLGFEVAELTPELRNRFFGGDESPGLLVTDVTVLKPAHIANIRRLDLLDTFNGKPVRGLEELRSALMGLKGGEKLQLTVVRRGERDESTVQAAGNIQARTSFIIPIIVSYDGEYRKSDFDLLLFIFGYESWDEWRDDGQRVDVRRCHDVGFLLNLINYESTYNSKTFSLLWFIKFRSSRS